MRETWHRVGLVHLVHTGLTRLREARNAGVPVAVGTDNVRDAFCPLGRHDPIQSLALAALVGHLDPPFGDILPMITTDAQAALGLPVIKVDGAAATDLLAFPVSTSSELLAGFAAPQSLTNLLKGVAA